MSDNNLDSFIKASTEYLTIFSYENQLALKKKFFNTSPPKRQQLWESFNLPVEEIKEKFQEMTKERSGLAQKKGHASYVDMRLEKYSIPQSAYVDMLKNVDKLIRYCRKQVSDTDDLPEWFYSKYNLPCYVCRIAKFPFESKNDVLKYWIEKYDILAKSKDKIDIVLGKVSSTQYLRKSGRFKITLDKSVNKRHQLLDLFHELAHVIVYLNNHKLEGPYFREKEALKIEIKTLKDMSKELYKSLFGEFLLVYWRVLFEIDLYENPDQDLSKLYAKTFNKCYAEGSQKENFLYLLDFRITLNPLSSLPHAVAQSEILLEQEMLEI
jgi:hypothetical protein